MEVLILVVILAVHGLSWVSLLLCMIRARLRHCGEGGWRAATCTNSTVVLRESKPRGSRAGLRLVHLLLLCWVWRAVECAIVLPAWSGCILSLRPLCCAHVGAHCSGSCLREKLCVHVHMHVCGSGCIWGSFSGAQRSALGLLGQ